jgi:hypothetical protein
LIMKSGSCASDFFSGPVFDGGWTNVSYVNDCPSQITLPSSTGT